MSERRDQESPEQGQTGAGSGAEPRKTSKLSWRPGPRVRSSARVGLVVIGLIVAFVLGTRASGPGEAEHTHEPASEAGEQQQIWTCSMHPQIRMDEPGQCPICGMNLVPAERTAKEETSSEEERITLSARARALAQVRTSPVVRTDPRAELRLLGRVDYDETRLRMVTPWTAGRIDRLHVRVTGERVRKGELVATVYSPEVYAAMRELVVARRQADKLAGALHGADNLARNALKSARERLRLLGVSKARIEEMEQTGQTPSHVKITSPFSGTIIERLVEEGDYVSAGTPLYHLANLSRVWVQVDAYEADLSYMQVGQKVFVEVKGLPGETFTGRVAFIDPVIDKKTRTARVRVEVANKSGQLRPGMFAEAVVESDLAVGATQLVIPSSAPLFTGRRSVVYVEAPETRGSYELREVKLGPKSGPVYPVLSGLSEGETVVTRGAFVIDADLQLAGGRSMMTLSDDLAARPDVSLTVTPQTLEALAPVVEAYLQAQEQLAADDLDRAREHLKRLAASVNELEVPGPRSSRETWREIAGPLAGHARHAASSEEGGDLRTAFEQLSKQIARVLQMFGNPLDHPLHIAFCPMAFDSKGAEWIQRTEDIHNPYYGRAMLRCGDVRASVLPGERLAVASKREPDPAPASGHQHAH